MTLINRSAADRKVSITRTDVKGDHLSLKLLAGAGIAINIVTAGDGSQTMVITTDGLEADQFGLHQFKWRTVNGCRVPMEAFILVDQTMCYMRNKDC